MPKSLAGRSDALTLIKRNLDAFVGRRITVRANRGRKRIMEAEGILEQTYPRIFVITLRDRQNTVKRLSYTYSDLLTETVELSVDGDRIGYAHPQRS
ncbi:MAG: Veg family protein [Bacillota bacterium]|nr:Veg family protein [Bacillota bacterium]